MSRIGKQARNGFLLVGILAVSLAAYAAAESGSDVAMTSVLAVIAGLMSLTVINM